MNFDKLLNKYLNELINNKGYNLRTTNLSNELLETLKIIEKCSSCKYNLGKHNLEFHESTNEIENYLAGLKKEQEQEKEDIIRKLNDKLIEIDDELNQKVLCEGCKGE